MEWLKFGGSTSFTDSHDTVKGMLGNATWFNQFEPRGRIVSQRLCYGYAIQWDFVAQLSVSMLYIGPVN